MKKTYFNWSSGKDASLSLYYLMQSSEYKVGKLLTSVNTHYNRVSMHGLRREVLEAQVKHIGLPLQTVELPEMPSMEVYETEMNKAMNILISEGYTHGAFGDIFLEDLKKYRDNKLKGVGIEGIYPIWKKDTTQLMLEFIELGFKAVTVCINGSLLDESFVGRELDKSFLKDLPDNVDPCGENGEFHTFCYDGPIFKKPVSIQLGEKTYREYKSPKKDKNHDNESNIGYWFCDLALDEAQYS